jgi:hypothetical protein
MQLLYTMLGLRLIFGTRLGCALFAVFGIVTCVALLSIGKPTSTGMVLLLLTAFALKRAVKPA